MLSMEDAPKQDEESAGDRGVHEVAKLRVRGSVRVTSSDWSEVALQIRLSKDGPWLSLTPEDTPLLVARQFGGKDRSREAPELYVVTTLRKVLEGDGLSVLSLSGSEGREGMGTTEYRYWAHLGARLSVAVTTRPDGTVALVGLS